MIPPDVHEPRQCPFLCCVLSNNGHQVSSGTFACAFLGMRLNAGCESLVARVMPGNSIVRQVSKTKHVIFR